jgi:hypothetical protein
MIDTNNFSEQWQADRGKAKFLLSWLLFYYHGGSGAQKRCPHCASMNCDSNPASPVLSCPKGFLFTPRTSDRFFVEAFP